MICFINKPHKCTYLKSLLWVYVCQINDLQNLTHFTANTKYCNWINKTHLFTHGFWVSDRGGEESIPFQSAVETGPVVVTVTSVRETPGNKGVELFVHGVTWFPCSTRAHTSHSSSGWSPLFFIWVCVLPSGIKTTERNWLTFSHTHNLLTIYNSLSTTLQSYSYFTIFFTKGLGFTKFSHIHSDFISHGKIKCWSRKPNLTWARSTTVAVIK